MCFELQLSRVPIDCFWAVLGSFSAAYNSLCNHRPSARNPRWKSGSGGSGGSGRVPEVAPLVIFHSFSRRIFVSVLSVYLAVLVIIGL
jgi:hypothetical protein